MLKYLISFKRNLKVYQCLGVLAKDSDFCLFPNITYFPLPELRIHAKSIKMAAFSGEEYAKKLGISHKVFNTKK